MPRVTVSLTDSILNKVDDQAHKEGISRSEYVATAIESYATGSNQANLELHNTQIELNKSQTEVMQLKRQIAKLENQLDKIWLNYLPSLLNNLVNVRHSP